MFIDLNMQNNNLANLSTNEFVPAGIDEQELSPVKWDRFLFSQSITNEVDRIDKLLL